MNLFALSHIEKVTLAADVQYAAAILEHKQSGLKLEGKTNSEIDHMVLTMEKTMLYIHQVYEYAEAQSRLTNDLRITLELAEKKNKILQEKIDFDDN